MNVLEKILEEVEEATFQEDAPIYLGDMEVDGYVRESVVKEIISHNMNHNGDDTEMDGWIPCSERLPEESGHYLVQLSRKIPYENFADRIVVLYDGEEKAFLDYESLIIAWQPLPEPYKPKKATAAGMEHIVSRFTKVE